MSVVRGRPPGFAGGIIGASRAYCSSLRACPAPKSPTKARLSAVHMVRLQEGSLLPEPPTSLPCAPAYPSHPGFSNGLSEDDRASTYSENSEDHTEAQADDLANPNSLHKDLPAPRPVEMTTTTVSERG